MKTCLVLEGGALRGIYTAGVLDALQKEKIKIDAIIGVSMGALIGLNYISNQPGRALRYNLKYCHDKNYISIYSLLKTGDIVNKELAYYQIPEQLDKFDYEAFDKSPISLYCTVTNVDTGKAEYIKIQKSKKDTEYLRAGGSMPGVSRIVSIHDKRYLDGGVADSIPVEKALDMGFDRIIVVLTRPLHYYKKLSKQRLLRIMYRRYPNFVKTLEKRNEYYNQTINRILSLEKENKIFVIRPSKKIPIKRIEHNAKRIQEQYDLGSYDFRKSKKKLIEYLNKKS